MDRISRFVELRILCVIRMHLQVQIWRYWDASPEIRFCCSETFTSRLYSRRETSTVNYRYNVTDGTLKILRYIRFYVIPV